MKWQWQGKTEVPTENPVPVPLRDDRQVITVRSHGASFVLEMTTCLTFRRSLLPPPSESIAYSPRCLGFLRLSRRFGEARYLNLHILHIQSSSQTSSTLYQLSRRHIRLQSCFMRYFLKLHNKNQNANAVNPTLCSHYTASRNQLTPNFRSVQQSVVTAWNHCGRRDDVAADRSKKPSTPLTLIRAEPSCQYSKRWSRELGPSGIFR